MYKTYREYTIKSRSTSRATSVASQWTHWSNGQASNELKIDPTQRIVTECWEEIESSLKRDDSNSTETEVEPLARVPPTSWKTVRVFVSSTFVDFHSEREILVKQVFPVLRDWCTERKLSLVVVDLRWGVPKDSPSRKTIAACLEELDRCHEETQGKPLFINMLAQRYGWIPEYDDVPTDIRGRYNWVDNVSITHMEILHGAYRCNNENAAFFLRDAQVLSDVPEHHRKRFMDTDDLPLLHMKTLKEKLKEKFPDSVFEYFTTYGGLDISTGREKVKLEGLKEFGQNILEFLKASIGKTYPKDDDSEPTPQQEDDESHEIVIDQIGRDVFGRNDDLEKLIAFIETGDSDLFTASFSEENGDYIDRKYNALLDQYNCSESEDSKLMCVEAEPGIGKSALFAALILLMRKQTDHTVWYHNVGCSPSSMNDSHLLTRLISALQEHGATENKKTYEQLLGTGLVEKQSTLVQILGQLRENPPLNQLVLLIDGLDELIGCTSPGHLSWLPPTWPPTVKCLISVNKKHGFTMERISWRKPLCLSLQPLDLTPRAEIVAKYFKKYNKAVDESQMASLLDHEGSSTPLWLHLACDELRVFGDFATLNTKINSLPDTVYQLQCSILERLIQEDDTEAMAKLISLIAVSKAGLPETDMLHLLSEDTEPMPLMTWATLRSCLGPFLRFAFDYSRNGKLTIIQFFHQSIYKVVEEMLLPDPATKSKWRLNLANYLESRCRHHSFVASELPYQLMEAGMHQRLASFFRQNKTSMFAEPFNKRETINKLRCKNVIQGTSNSVEFMLCKMCSQKPGVLSPTLPSSWACVVCGNNAQGPGTQEARICGRHAGSRLSSPVKSCINCNMPVQRGQGFVGKLCMPCSAGISRCSHIG